MFYKSSIDKLKKFAEEAEEPRGWRCSCGCGCTQRSYNPTGSYCSWCENGQCGEWPGGPNWECPNCEKIRNWDDFQDTEQPPICTNRYCMRQRGYSDEEITKAKEQVRLQKSEGRGHNAL
jgi:hypothetical protein